MENTKIFVDCHVFNGKFQGLTSYIKGLYTELIKHEEITFYLASDDPVNLELLFGRHKNVFYIKYRFKNKYIRLFFDIPYLANKFKVDFAHFQYTISPFINCKYIVTIHDVMYFDFPQYFSRSYKLKTNNIFKWSAKKSDIVLTVSDYSKQRIKKHFNISEIFVTKNAVDPVFYEDYNKISCQKYIESKFGTKNFFLFVSRFEPRKNHITLLKVFIENKYYLENELVFIGNEAHICDEFNKYYETLSSDLKQKIKIFKRINFYDLVEFTRAATISIYPSYAEGFGIPPLESIATGTPTVCSNTTAMSDFNFIDNFMFNPSDKNDMIKKIDSALKFNNWNDIKEQMKSKYNWKYSADVFLKAISKNSF